MGERESLGLGRLLLFLAVGQELGEIKHSILVSVRSFEVGLSFSLLSRHHLLLVRLHLLAISSESCVVLFSQRPFPGFHHSGETLSYWQEECLQITDDLLSISVWNLLLATSAAGLLFTRHFSFN